jgi:hypothetical protein
MISAAPGPSSGRRRLRFRRVFKWLILSVEFEAIVDKEMSRPRLSKDAA